ncbi:D-alanyl-D-alanine carboxypeptidase/D-alanyl-D-alanine endopeptidase [Legionella fairfieldensis]|uniref:D-alanyl-D-alanine carboxypeptidase/D-alanyl-D-alanine endopeptidase n=1 Tax=Legionella fairfieldensis TaxID=45064 RepID=UPI00048D3E72|nr:D-alanyl-D-alanine carboxypeptidase/D-alanyl-D-alanine-endopeptidase [Legionella fairfieldensis]
MKKNYFLVFSLFVSFLLSTGLASQPVEFTSLSQKIDSLLHDFGENINIGILVQDAKTGEILYQKDSDRYFTPASNQKLFTAFAALHDLGPDFSYQTRLYLNPEKIDRNNLNDDLYIQFTGDPSLTFTQLDKLINSLSQAGIQTITGKIIVDDLAFDEMVMSPGTAWEDQDFCWSSPISASTIEHNCVSATVGPANEVNQPALLKLPPYPQSMRFINQVVTRPAGAKNCVIMVKRSAPDTYTLSGCIQLKAAAQTIEMAVRNPRDNIRLVLNYLLKKNNIVTDGKISFQKLAISFKPFATQSSPPLKVLVSTMLKKSDNTIADALFKTMGAMHAGVPGSFKKGSKAVRDILAETIQINFPKTTFIDGSGGSRYNFLTPQQIVILLQNIFLLPDASDFISSLAVAGVDGTLKERMKDPLTQGKIWAKTGSETAVTSLSGYLETRKKRTLIFSIMINGFTDPASKYKALEDKICKILVEAG